MQTGAAAHTHLAAAWPDLAPAVDAIVNLGPFSCSGPGVARLLLQQPIYDSDLDG